MKPRAHRNWARRVASLSFAVTALATTGCFTTTIKNGSPSLPPTMEYDSKWHHGLIFGIAELSGPYDLSKVCPHGWSEITTEATFLTGLVSAITYNIYSPQSVTIQCASGGASPANAPATPPASASPPPAAPPTQ